FVEAGILTVAKPTGSERRRGSGGDFRRAGSEVGHYGVRGSHLRRRLRAGFGNQTGVVRSRARKAAGHHRAFHNPKLVRVSGAVAEHGVVGLQRANERIGGRMQVGGCLRIASPEIDGFLAGSDRRGGVTARDNEWIARGRALFGTNGLFAAATRRFLLAAAHVNEETFRYAQRENPFVGRNAPSGERAASGNQL